MTSTVPHAPAAAVQAEETVSGSLPQEAAHPLVRAALAILDGLPLARVGRTIAPDTTGWYVRPDTLASPAQVTVRHVHRGSLRPASAAARRACRAVAAERFVRAGWRVLDFPATVLVVEAPGTLADWLDRH
ncbi:hypothetical protein AB0940_34570 [Streptomyces sp. NPDC006656]|uniref:hypothetical protein n=1 Tax=Streptomyces sp. NPDC006656 TaxID=3156899 RepID=UPI0034537736